MVRWAIETWQWLVYIYILFDMKYLPPFYLFTSPSNNIIITNILQLSTIPSHLCTWPISLLFKFWLNLNRILKDLFENDALYIGLRFEFLKFHIKDEAVSSIDHFLFAFLFSMIVAYTYQLSHSTNNSLQVRNNFICLSKIK